MDIVKIEKFSRLDCCRHGGDPLYKTPTKADFELFKTVTCWTDSDVCRVLGLPYNPEKGSKLLRQWRADPENINHREIPYSAWRYLIGVAELVDTSGDHLYFANPEHLLLVEEFKRRACTLDVRNPEYVPPTAEDINYLIDVIIKPETYNHFAIAFGLSTSAREGSRTFRNWRTKGNISYPAWRMMLAFAGMVVIKL